MDFILDKKEVMSAAMHTWKMMWAPAVHAYGETLTGKQQTAFREAKEAFRGMYLIIVPQQPYSSKAPSAV